MADTDVKSSETSGATQAPSPSPSTVAPGTAGARPFQITHLQPQPVTSRVYQAIAEVNSGFEKLTQDMHGLLKFSFFPTKNLLAWLNQIRYMQAHANYRLLASLDSRETNNAAYYDRLCRQWERQLKDPNDVLIEAEHRKQEIAEEQQRQEEEDLEES